MWGSTGRSGYGDSTVGGDYDSWDGVSPNGKQYRNEATMETRDLSGADYWHLRKQNRPTEEIPVELHMLKSGKANINAYADKAEPVKKATKVPLADRILPQAKRVRVLTEQLYELEAEKKAGMDIHSYSNLRDILIAKRDRAQVLLDKASKVKPIREEIEEDSAHFYASTFDSAKADAVEGEAVGVVWIDEISDRNSFKSFLKMSCKVARFSIELSHKAKAYYRTLKEV